MWCRCWRVGETFVYRRDPFTRVVQIIKIVRKRMWCGVVLYRVISIPTSPCTPRTMRGRSGLVFTWSRKLFAAETEVMGLTRECGLREFVPGSVSCCYTMGKTTSRTSSNVSEEYASNRECVRVRAVINWQYMLSAYDVVNVDHLHVDIIRGTDLIYDVSVFRARMLCL